MAGGEDENKKAKPSCLHLLHCKSVLVGTVVGVIEEGTMFLTLCTIK